MQQTKHRELSTVSVRPFKSLTVHTNVAKAQQRLGNANRIKYYKQITATLGLDITGEKLDCADMKAFNTDGSGAMMIYWDKEWGWDANTPGTTTSAVS